MILADANASVSLRPVRLTGRYGVRLEVSSPSGTWLAEDPALEPREFASIPPWLEQVARGRRPNALGFTEPNLEFELVQQKGDFAHLRVWIEGELRPSWAPWSRMDMRDLGIDLTVSRSDLTKAAETLRDELTRFS